jgi:signal transduction histidine kinase/ActR/RegA family two-component response regulator
MIRAGLSSLMETLRTLVGWFVPPGLGDVHSGARQRAELLVCFCIALGAWGPLFGAFYWQLGLPRLAVANVLATVAVAVPLAILKVRGAIAVAANLAAAILATILLFDALSTMGGLHSPAFTWLPLVPIVAFLGGWRWAAAWAGAMLLAVLALFLVPERGMARPAVTEDTFALARAVALGGAVLATLSLGWLYDTGKGRALRVLAQANREIAAARERAEEAARMKSEFLANMSHEIRTPLGGLIGMMDLALETGLTEEQRGYVQAARSSALHLRRILDDVLDLSKIEAGRISLETAPIVLRDDLEAAMQPFTIEAERRGLALTYEVADDVPGIVHGDAHRLRQVLLNLVDNAVKFTPAGGIVVRAAVASRTAASVLVHFTVTDTGIGIPRDKQRLVFDSFTQADGSHARRYGGTGLGLGISAKFVELMGGRIWVESEVDRGSRFHFTVRLGLDGGTDARAERPARRGVAASRALRLLVVEDNALNAKVTARLLEKRGHAVVVVGTGRDALAILERQRFDVVLMDVQMPEMDGVQATTAIRERERKAGGRVPIVAITAHAMREDRERCLGAGMDAYVSKPVDPAALFAAIEQVLGPGEAAASA